MRRSGRFYRWVIARRWHHFFAPNPARYEFFELIASLYGRDSLEQVRDEGALEDYGPPTLSPSDDAG